MAYNNYKEYLQSEHWRTLSFQTKKERGFRCEACGKRLRARDLETHHKCYERLGHELPEDLEVLCREHHHDRHFPMRRIEAELERWIKEL